MKSLDQPHAELLTVDQFALRLTVSRTTAFEWLKNGILIQGKHYFKVGRILRFVWNEALLLSLGITGKTTKEKKQHKAVRPTDNRRLHRSAAPSVNIDY